MNRKLAIVPVVLALVAGLVYWFGFRDRGEGGAPAPAGASAGSSSGPAAPARARAGGDDGPAGQLPPLSFETDPEGRLLLEGQVLDEHDQPVAGAEVRISSSPPRTTRTDTDGSFSFDKLLGRTYYLRARAGDRAGNASAKVTAQSDPVVIRLRQGATLTVLVVDGTTRKPIAGATVLRLGDDDHGEATTGGDGKAVLRGVDDGWVQVSASAPGYGPATASRSIGASERQVELEVALAEGAPVSGRVVDERGQPIAGAQVWAQDASSAWEGGAGERAAVRSDKAGAFTIPALSAGSYILFAKDEVHAPAATAPVTIAGEVPTTGVEIVMQAAAVVAGVVVDPGGAPVPYATVRVSSRVWSASMVYRQAAADDQGRFEVRGLPRAALRARAEGEEASSAAIDLDLAAIAEQRDLRLVLDRSAQIAGVVVDGDGEPVAEATVSAYPDFTTVEVDWVMASTASAATDGGGRFTLKGLDDGAYRVWATREGGGGRRASTREGVAARTGDRDVRLVLPAPGGIKGKIALEDGGAPALAIVSVGWQERVTVKDGAFALADLAPGRYDVRVTGLDFAERVKGDVEVTAGKVTDAGTITVRAGRTLAGKVVDDQGQPVEGARVLYGKMLFGDGKRTGATDADTAAQLGQRIATSNAAGEFVIRGAPRTSGALLAEHPTLGRSVAQKIAAGKDDVRGLTVALRGYGSIAGKVMRKGEPVAGATVNAAPVGSSGQAVFVQAGADGSFVFDRLPAGPTALSAMKTQGFGGGQGGSRTVAVVAGQQVDGTIVLPAGDLTLTVKIEPRPGATINLAQVFLFRGVVAAQNGEQIMDAYLASGGVEGGRGDTTLAVGGAAGRLIWLGGSPLSFTELLPGDYSACGIPITGNFMDEQLMARIFRNLDKLEVFCRPVTVRPSPATQETSLSMPSMVALPAEDEP